MTIIDAFGIVFGAIGAFFSAPAFWAVIGVVAIVVSVILVIAGIAGLFEGDFETATPCLLIGIAMVLTGIAICIWVGPSASPWAW